MAFAHLIDSTLWLCNGLTATHCVCWLSTFPLELRNRQVLACMHSLSHTSFYVLFSLSRSFCPSVVPSNYFSLFRLSLSLSGEGEIFEGLHIVQRSTVLLSKTLLLTNCHLSVSDEGCSNSFFLCPWPSFYILFLFLILDIVCALHIPHDPKYVEDPFISVILE